MIHAVILAAGRSRRMGTQKLLLPYKGQSLIAHIVDQALSAPLDGTIVVLSPHTRGVKSALAGRSSTRSGRLVGPDRVAGAGPSPERPAEGGPLIFATNPDPEGDMLSSVRCGLKALPSGCEAVCVLLGDQPAITADLLCRMIGAFASAGRGIVVPVYNGRRGHPLLFSLRYGDEVLTRYDGTGLRGLLHAHPEDIHELAVATPSVLTDVDTPADYDRDLKEYSD